MPVVALDVTRSGWGGDVKKIEEALILYKNTYFGCFKF